MILIVQAEWNASVTDALAKAAIQSLEKANYSYQHLRVPGALEIPLAIKWAWAEGQRRQKPIEGAVALGCVIRGETYHFDLVANDGSRALSDLSLDLRIPIGHGVLAVYEQKQAVDRAGGASNKGTEAAEAVIAMLKLKAQIESARKESL